MANVLVVNFKGVDPAKGRRADYVEPGTYRLEIVAADAANISSTKKKMPTVDFTVAGNGSQKGKRLFDQFVIESAGGADEIAFGLQRLLALLNSCGVNPPKKQVSLDLDRLVGKSCIAEVYDDEYNGRKVSRLGAYILPDAEVDDDEDEEEEEPPKRAAAKPATKAAAKPAAKVAAPTRRRAAAPVEDDEDEDEEGEDEEEDEDEDFPF